MAGCTPLPRRLMAVSARLGREAGRSSAESAGGFGPAGWRLVGHPAAEVGSVGLDLPSAALGGGRIG